jgi:hypothetical protein
MDDQDVRNADEKSLFSAWISLFCGKNSLIICLGNPLKSPCGIAVS